MSNWRTLDKGERLRTYHFINEVGEPVLVDVENVERLRVSPTGTHYIETEDGRKLIVKNTWYVLEIEADEWSF